MKDLESKIIRIVKRVQSRVEFVEVENVSDSEISLLFDCPKDDGILFSSRDGEEDDDFPDFIGSQKLESKLEQDLGEEYVASAMDHEKGLFSIIISKKK